MKQALVAATDYKQHVPCLNVHVCLNFVKSVLEAQTHLVLFY